MGTNTPSDGLNVNALLELCDAQQNAIERLQAALAQHEEIEHDRHLLKRMLAHELRTPLTAVIGSLYTLALPKLSPEKHEDLRQKALKQAQQLNAMIDDILTLADPHQASVDRAPQEWVLLEDLLADVAAQVDGTLAADRLVVSAPPDLQVRTIPSRLRQILVNLVVNAAKYSPPDRPVTVIATRLTDDVVFEIVDEGPGIDPATVDGLFEPFRRGETNGADGIGLGLYLVRNLVRSLAGTIELTPRATGGTLARVRIPQKRLEDARPPARHLRSVPAAD